MEDRQLIQAMAALAQETRLEVVRILAAAGGEADSAADLGVGSLSVGAIAEKLGGVNPATLSHHLKELSNAGLIQARRKSRHIFYSINRDVMAVLIDNLQISCSIEDAPPTRVGDSFTPSFLGR